MRQYKHVRTWMGRWFVQTGDLQRSPLFCCHSAFSPPRFHMDGAAETIRGALATVENEESGFSLETEWLDGGTGCPASGGKLVALVAERVGDPTSLLVAWKAPQAGFVILPETLEDAKSMVPCNPTIMKPRGAGPSHLTGDNLNRPEAPQRFHAGNNYTGGRGRKVGDRK